MEFEKEALFKQLVSNSGMNLYLGAGFSAYAYNSDKESLPLGNIINERLIEMFSLDKSRNFNLIEIEGLLGSGVFRVKKENVREVLCQATLFENVKFGDGKLYVELVSILGLIQ